MNIQSSKEKLRKIVTKQRSTLSPSDKLDFDKAITQVVVGNSYFLSATCIAIYVSLPYEVDTTTIISQALDRYTKHIVVPKIVHNKIEFFRIESLSDLVIGTYGIKEPNKSSKPTPLSDIDLYIVPGVAFSTTGDRLGMGKGYFDRALQHSTTPVMGLAYDNQVLPQIPYTKHDRKVDIIITPTKIYDLKHNSISSYKRNSFL